METGRRNSVLITYGNERVKGFKFPFPVGAYSSVPLTLNSDKHLISPDSVTPESNIKVIMKSRSSLRLNKYFPCIIYSSEVHALVKNTLKEAHMHVSLEMYNYYYIERIV